MLIMDGLLVLVWTLFGTVASKCTSNIQFTDNLQGLTVTSIRLDPCYKSPGMKTNDGCGSAKGENARIYINLQRDGSRRLTDFGISVTAYPNSLGGTGFPYPLGVAGTPCEASKNPMICPADKPLSYIYTIYVEIGITGIMAMLIPKGEKLKSKFTLDAKDMDSGETVELGTIEDLYMEILESDDELVKNKVMKVPGEPVCRDVKPFAHPYVHDESTDRVTFDRYNSIDSNQGIVYFHVRENPTRRSFGTPEMKISVNNKEVPLQSKYPCGAPVKDQKPPTCQFTTLRQPSSNDKQVSRQYKIHFDKNIDALQPYLEGPGYKNSNITLTFQGIRKRAYGRVTMPLTKLVGEKSVSSKQKASGDTGRKKTHSKRKRRKLWNYDLAEFQARLDAYGSGSQTRIVDGCVVMGLLTYLFL